MAFAFFLFGFYFFLHYTGREDTFSKRVFDFVIWCLHVIPLPFALTLLELIVGCLEFLFFNIQYMITLLISTVWL